MPTNGSTVYALIAYLPTGSSTWGNIYLHIHVGVSGVGHFADRIDLRTGIKRDQHLYGDTKQSGSYRRICGKSVQPYRFGSRFRLECDGTCWTDDRELYVATVGSVVLSASASGVNKNFFSEFGSVRDHGVFGEPDMDRAVQPV